MTSTLAEDRIEQMLSQLMNHQISEELSNEQLIFNQRNDPSLQYIIEDCERRRDKISSPFAIENQILYKLEKDGKKLLVIPRALVESILKIYHHNDLLIHPSISRLYPLLRSRFYWVHMHRDCTNWVNACTQ